MSILDTITGGKTSQASGALEKALQAIQAVETPTADEMKYQIQKLVQAGVLTPQQAKTYLQNPSAFSKLDIDQTGTHAQEQAISELLSAAQQGGLNPQAQAETDQITRNLGSQEKGANDAVIQNQAARGALTSGETLAAQMQNNQNATANANQRASDTAGQAYQAMLGELTSAGSLGSGLQGQKNTQGNTVAAATDAINKFNATQQQNQENLNVGNNNTAQQFNLENEQGIGNQNVANENDYSKYQAQLPQEVFQDELQKAGAEAGVNTRQADLDTQQGGQEAGLIGGVVGAGGNIAAARFKQPAASSAPPAGYNPNITEDMLPGGGFYNGGEIHDYLNGGRVGGKAQVHGDSPKNDTVPAVLSPGEVVLPRSVTQDPREDNVMAFLNRIRAKKEVPPVHPHDIKSVLDGLSLRRSA